MALTPSSAFKKIITQRRPVTPKRLPVLHFKNAPLASFVLSFFQKRCSTVSA